MVPEMIGRFKVEAEITQHPFGSVYKGFDPKFHRPVALRTFRLDVPSPQAQQQLRRFQAEARTASALSSPNIVSIYGGGEDQGCFFVVMEYVEGLTLQAMLLGRSEVSTGDLVDMTRQACLAFDHAQSHRMVHPNLRPANVMIEWDGSVKIMDFGVPKPAPAELAETTPLPDIYHYLSPEQVKGEPVDVRSAMFSWAAILYELATGIKPFSGGTPGEVTGKILEYMPEPPRDLKPMLGPGISHVIMKALAKSPADRYQTGAELVHEIENHKNFGRAETMASRVAAPVSEPNVEAGIAPVPVSSGTARTQSGMDLLQSSLETFSDPGNGAAAGRTQAPALEFKNLEFKNPVPAEAAAPAPKAPAPPAAPPVIVQGQVFPAVTEQPSAQDRTAERAASPPFPRPTLRPMLPTLPPLPPQQKQFLMYGGGAVLLFLVITSVAVLGFHGSKKPAASPAPELVSVTPVTPPQVDTTAVEQEAQTPEVVRSKDPNPKKNNKRAKVVAVATPAPVVTTGEVSISSNPAGAQIQIDGRTDPSWVTPYTAAGLNGGSHTVTLSKSGYAAQSQVVQVVAGGSSSLSLKLAELFATISFASEPAGASIAIDGKPTGKTTPAQINVEKGHHTLTFSKAGYFDAASTADLAAGQNFHVSPTLQAMGDTESIKVTGKFKKVFGGGVPEGMASIEVKTMPRGARIEVNHRMLDKPSPAEFFVTPGNYQVTVFMTGYKPLEKMVSVEAGSKVVITDNLER
ncbi:MAG TPA: serine/threonine-protein kinase [Terriglobales bacterium]|nr:serine/threonine-protein kinase [Terriglobales bacterium]